MANLSLAQIQQLLEENAVDIQSGALPTNAGNRPLAEANIQQPQQRGDIGEIVSRAMRQNPSSQGGLKPQSSRGDFIGKIADIMSATGAGLLGKEDPVAKRREKEKKQEVEQQKVNLQKFKFFTDFMESANMSPETANELAHKFVDFDPGLKRMFGGMEFTFDGKEYTVDRDFKRGEFVDPSGRSFPDGSYRVTGRLNEEGVFTASKVQRIKPVGADERTKSGLQARAIAHLATDPETGKIDDDKLLEAIKAVAPTARGANSRVLEIIEKKNADKATPADVQSLEDYKTFLRESSQQRAVGTQVGAEAGRQFVASEAQQRIAAEAGAQTRGSGLGKQEIPGSGANLINPNTLTFADPGMTGAEARAAGFTQPVTPKQKESLAGLEAVGTAFSELVIVAEKVKASNFIGLKSSAIPGSQFVSESAKVGSLYKSVSFRFSQLYDSLIGGVRAAASLPFAQFVSENVLPSFDDANDVIDFKLTALNIVIESLKEEKRREVTGRPPDSKVAAMLEELAINLDKIDRGQLKKSTQPSGQGGTLEDFKRSKGIQ